LVGKQLIEYIVNQTGSKVNSLFLRKTDYNEQTEALKEELEAENERLKEDIAGLSITKEETGESIDITDSAEMRFAKFGVSGNSKQDTSKITYTCNGTETGMYYFTYNNINYQFTMPTIEEGDILVFHTVTLKLYLGETEITTEIGTTGTQLTFISSPSPDYPQEIHSVGDNVNLFDKDTIYRTNSLIQNSGNITNNSDFDIYKNTVNENKQYTLSITNTGEINRDCRICGFQSDGTFIKEITTFTINANNKATKTFITPANTEYILYHVAKTSDKIKLEQRYSSNRI